MDNDSPHARRLDRELALGMGQLWLWDEVKNVRADIEGWIALDWKGCSAGDTG